MTDADLLAEAAAELYAGDPAAFTERRGALAAQARAAGQAVAAKQITALRKPTYSAWLVNQLVRADPEVASQLSELGGELRSAGAALDGARIRELSQQRRRLVDDLVRQALQVPGAGPPSAAVREELTATFGAALADPQVADQLAAGTLVRAVHRADFTPAGPGLMLVPPLPADRPARSGSRTPVPPTGRTRAGRAGPVKPLLAQRHRPGPAGTGSARRPSGTGSAPSGSGSGSRRNRNGSAPSPRPSRRWLRRPRPRRPRPRPSGTSGPWSGIWRTSCPTPGSSSPRPGAGPARRPTRSGWPAGRSAACAARPHCLPTEIGVCGSASRKRRKQSARHTAAPSTRRAGR